MRYHNSGYIHHGLDFSWQVGGDKILRVVSLISWNAVGDTKITKTNRIVTPKISAVEFALTPFTNFIICIKVINTV